jgi:hypothetical protein
MRDLVVLLMLFSSSTISDIGYQISAIRYPISDSRYPNKDGDPTPRADYVGPNSDNRIQNSKFGKQEPGSGSSLPTFDTSDAVSFRRALLSLSTPALEQRNRNRREMQQRHYAEVLYELIQMDAVGSLLASVRSQAQLELQLPQTPLSVTIPIKQPPPPQPGLPGFTGTPSAPYVVTLFEDRQFPVDPWGKP